MCVVLQVIVSHNDKINAQDNVAMVADDDPVSGKIIGRLLEQLGWSKIEMVCLFLFLSLPLL